MKYFSLKILIIFFFLSGFLKVFSQEEKLEVYFDINEDGSAFSNTDEILVEYNIKNEKDEIIGRVILDPGMDEFQYFNIKNEIVAYRWNFDKTNSSPFDNKKTKFSVRDKKSVDLIFKQEWNPEKDRFDIFSTGDKLIGNISLNLKTGLWEFYKIQTRWNTYDPIFANYFEVKSGNSNGSNVVKSTYQIVTGNVIDDQGVPLPGATVLELGTSNGTTTDFDGNFSITVSQGAVFEVSYVGYKTKEVTVSSGKNYTIRLTQKKKFLSPIYPEGFSFNISQNVAQSLQDNQGGNDQKNNGSSKIRFGAEYHDLFDDYNSMGITFGIGKSDTLVSDEYNLSDIDFAVTYGLSFLYNIMKLKVGLGYYSKNYNVTESFGPFYDFEEGVYYSAGLQLYIPLGESGITLDGYYNNYGLGYGIGFKF